MRARRGPGGGKRMIDPRIRQRHQLAADQSPRPKLRRSADRRPPSSKRRRGAAARTREASKLHRLEAHRRLAGRSIAADLDRLQPGVEGHDGEEDRQVIEKSCFPEHWLQEPFSVSRHRIRHKPLCRRGFPLFPVFGGHRGQPSWPLGRPRPNRSLASRNEGGPECVIAPGPNCSWSGAITFSRTMRRAVRSAPRPAARHP